MIVSALCIGLAITYDESGDYDMARQFHDLDQVRYHAENRSDHLHHSDPDFESESESAINTWS